MSLTVSNLSKSYGKQLVLNDISFSINKGEIVGFLGNNGAGKSTTMKIITGYRSFDAGKVEVCGRDITQYPMECRRNIGYLPEHNPIYPEMYVKEYLLFVANLYQVKNPQQQVDIIVEKTGLTSEYTKKIGMLSKGFRQRVGLAQALIHDPQVLILDEPTTGLDPNQIVEVRNLIKEVGREKTVMLSTHIMQEVSAICDRVIILNKGRIAADNTESNILLEDNGDLKTFVVEFSKPQTVENLTAIQGVEQVKAVNDTTFLFSSQTDISEAVFNYAVANQCVLKTLKQQERTMEQAFRDLTK